MDNYEDDPEGFHKRYLMQEDRKDLLLSKFGTVVIILSWVIGIIVWFIYG